MFNCEVCGGVEFEKYAGFMYCVECQTQTQEYQEQEHEYQETDTVKQSKARKRPLEKKAESSVQGVWTSWEAFNHILHGMTKELSEAFNLPPQFRTLVLKLWAAYLKACKAAFTSTTAENLPKFQCNFKHRDVKVLYNMDVDHLSRKSHAKSKTSASVTNLSSTSLGSRSLARKKSKMIADSYKESQSELMLSQSSIHDETLESLGRSSLTGGTEEDEGDDKSSSKESFLKLFKDMFTSKDYKSFKETIKSKGLKFNSSEHGKKSIKSLAKNKLLSIIHMALLMAGSEIQLSDLLRLIREGHLSYAKVTHFLPSDVKFSKNDLTYIDVISDAMMPTHLRQRQISSQLGYLLGIKKIRSPKFSSLVKRYCCDLNLPDEICQLSVTIACTQAPKSTVPRAKGSMPSYEAWAMVSIIVAMKLTYGLNDKTEIFLSDLAQNLNRLNKGDDVKSHFVFKDWQNYLECRKTALIEYHYPTQEQLNGRSLKSSKKFLNMLLKESRDDHKNSRFIPYKKYYMDENLLTSVKQMLGQLTRPLELNFLDFEPSLTPQTSYLETIMSNLSPDLQTVDGSDIQYKYPFPVDILKRSFGQTTIDAASDPKKYLKALQESHPESLANLRFYSERVISQESEGHSSGADDKAKILLNCSSRYWIKHRSNSTSEKLCNFEWKVLRKTSRNFQWFLKECARMLEMNVRDVYDDLMTLEKQLINSNVINP